MPKSNSIFNKKAVAGIFALLFLLSILTLSQYALANSNVRPLVETEWLAKNLKKHDIRIVYVGSMAPNDMAKFGSKHIPGSAYMSLKSLMKVLGNGSTPPNIAEFEALMGRLGISNNTHVVLYGEGGGNPFITNAFWLMDYFGHKKVSYLNGGMAKWSQEKRQVETGAPTKVGPTKYKATPDPSIFADADYVLKNLKNPQVVIVDTRSPEEYTGKNAMGNKRTGHIPGAVNLNFYPTNLNKDETFKSVKDLKAAYEAKGVTKDKEVITYCQAGIRAAHTYFVLKHLLGYPNVRNYVGSWGEWGNRLDPSKYPVEK